MRKQKLLAGILAAVMTVSSMPASALAVFGAAAVPEDGSAVIAQEAVEEQASDMAAEEQQVEDTITEDNVAAGIQDVAVYASPSADYTASWEDVNGVNNASFEPTASSNVGSTSKGWGNWKPMDPGSEHWLQYDWGSEITTDKFEVYWYDDGGATRVPATVAFQYMDSNHEWQDIAMTSTYDEIKAVDTYNTVNISEVTTKAIRMNVTIAESPAAATGVLRWKVYAEYGDEDALKNLTGKLKVPERATMDFQLKSSLDDGVSVSWDASGHEAITIEDGWAVISRGTEDVAGTLKATVSKDGASVEKDFPITVAKQSGKTAASGVDFTKVHIDDEYWSPRQKAFICETIPTGIEKVEASGGCLNNFIEATKKNSGEAAKGFEGSVFFLDSDPYKMIEAMSYALQINPNGDQEIIDGQTHIRETLEKWIPYIQGAQEDDGYLDTFFTLDHTKTTGFENNETERWTDFQLHEFYVAGHFYEGAVAYTRATNYEDTRLLDVAVKNADLTVKTFGLDAGQRKACPGHEEIELALVKLAAVCQEMGDKIYNAASGETYAEKSQDYIRQAQFFLSVRGDLEDRYGYNSWGLGEYQQENCAVTEIEDPVGHAVRCMYLYMAMSDIALLEDTDIYDHALLTVWENLTNKKSYVTGGIGSSALNEGFGEDYDLPNETAYAETCANIGSVMWNYRMNLLYGDSKYIDVLERTLYNSVMSGVNFDGDKFFYSNPHYSDGGSGRSAWFGCACCPPNLMRLVENLGGYIYTQNGSDITMNLYIGNHAEFTVEDNKTFKFDVETDMPWYGTTRITVAEAPEDVTFANLRLRVPEWVSGDVEIKLNTIEYTNFTVNEQGYIELNKPWFAGDTVEINFPMETERYHAPEQVKNDLGKMAVKRGPVVFAAEGIDNDFDLSKGYVPEGNEFTTTWSDNLMGENDADPYGLQAGLKVTVAGKEITDMVTMATNDVTYTLIPYYAWNNRDYGSMRIFIDEAPKELSLRDYATPSVSYVGWGAGADRFADDSMSSFWNGHSDPSLTSDASYNQWAMYDFGELKAKIESCSVNYYDDKGGVMAPTGVTLEYMDADGNWKEVVRTNEFTFTSGTSDEAANIYTFEPVVTNKIRMTFEHAVSGGAKVAVAVYDWKLSGSISTDTPDPIPTDTPDPTPTDTPDPTPTDTPDPTPVVTVGKVTGLKAVPSTTSVKLTWKKVSGATGYVVMRAKNSSKTYSKIKTIKSNTAGYTNKSLAYGTGYKYKVYAYKTVDGKPTDGQVSSVVKTVTKPAKVTGMKIKRTTKVSNAAKATLTFKTAKGADIYRIYQYNKSKKKYEIAYKVQNKKLYKYSTRTKKYTKVRTVSIKRGKVTVKLTGLKLKNAKSMKFKVQAGAVVSGYKTAYGTKSGTVTLK